MATQPESPLVDTATSILKQSLEVLLCLPESDGAVYHVPIIQVGTTGDL